MKNTKKIIISIVLLVGVSAAWYILHKNQLEQFVDRAIDAFTAENKEEVLDLISDTYLSRYNWSRDHVDGELQRFFKSFDDVTVIVDDVKTEFLSRNDGMIVLDFKVLATLAPGQKLGGDIDMSVYGNKRFYLVGSPTAIGHIEMKCRRVDDRWFLDDILKVDVGYPIPNEVTNSASDRPE